MDPDHHGFTPRRPSQPERLPPELALVTAHPLELLPFLLLASLDVLEVARNPLVLTALVHKLQAVLLERRDGVQCEIVVRSNQRRRPRHHHRRHGLVDLQELLDLLGGHSDKVRLDVFGVADEGAGVDDRGEGFGGQVAPIAEQADQTTVLLIWSVK